MEPSQNRIREKTMKQDGKSMVEMLMVLAITGIVAVLAVPKFQLLASRTHAQAATDEITSELRLARQLALINRDRVRLVFDLEQRTISAELLRTGRIHHVYHFEDRGIVIEEISAGPEIQFHPS